MGPATKCTCSDDPSDPDFTPARNSPDHGSVPRIRKDLDTAVEQLLASAQTAFTVSDTTDDIKQSTDALRDLMRQWREHAKRVEWTVIGLLRRVQSRCTRVGAAGGYNERDESWMASSPTCGKSE